MNGPVNVRAYSWRCTASDCPCPDVRYRAQRELWRISLPKFGYGLDVIAYIGWQRDQKFRQFCEIQLDLQSRGIEISERHVGRLYRQYLSLLGGLNNQRLDELKKINSLHGGVVWALDALQPDQDGTQLYVLYEAISETTVAAAWLDKRNSDHLIGWLKPYSQLDLTVLATLSDGEDAEIKALKALWSDSPHQMCLTHFLGDCAKPIKDADNKLKAALRQGMGPLPPVPGDENSAQAGPLAATPVLQEPTNNHKAGQIDSLDSSNNKNEGDKHEENNNCNTHHGVANRDITKTQRSDKKQEAQAEAEMSNVQCFDYTNQLSCTGDLKPHQADKVGFIATEQSKNSSTGAVPASVLAPDIVQNEPANSLDKSPPTTTLVDYDPSHGGILAISFSTSQEFDANLASSVSQTSLPQADNLFEPASFTICCEPQTDLLGEPLVSYSKSEISFRSTSTIEISDSPLPKGFTILAFAKYDDLAPASSDIQAGFACSPTVSSISTDTPEVQMLEQQSNICQKQLRMREIEHLLRKSFQQVLKHPSRYPSTFGGLAGYQQLTGIVQAMREQLPEEEDSYLHRLFSQGEQALNSATCLACEVAESAGLLAQLTNILFEPLSPSPSNLLSAEKSGADVKLEVYNLLDLSNKSPSSLTSAFITQTKCLIDKWNASLFNCYDVPLLPPNNAALESRFNRLRRGQRRISGRKKTTELRRTAHLQLLLYAETREQLLEQFQEVSQEAYLKARISLEAAEERQRELARLRRKPYQTASALIAEYFKLCQSNRG